jgi:hypothetical protein
MGVDNIRYHHASLYADRRNIVPSTLSYCFCRPISYSPGLNPKKRGRRPPRRLSIHDRNFADVADLIWTVESLYEHGDNGKGLKIADMFGLKPAMVQK